MRARSTAVASAGAVWEIEQVAPSTAGPRAPLGLIEGDFRSHHHDDADEFFMVIDGQLHIDIEDRESVVLDPHQGYTVRGGVVHRTRAPVRTAILMVESTGVVPTGD